MSHFICKANGKLNNDWNCRFDFGVLLLSVRTSEDTSDLFDVLVLDGNELIRYYARPGEIAGDEIAFSKLPPVLKSKCLRVHHRERRKLLV